MTLFALLFVLFFVVLVVGGVFVHVYMYANGAFGKKMRRGRKIRLGAVSLSQTATVPTAVAVAELYPGEHKGRSTHMRILLLYSLAILLALVILTVLVIGTTQF